MGGQASKALNEGDRLHGIAENEQAILYYYQAIELYPNYPEAYFKLGLTLSDLRRYDEAISSFNEVIKLRKDYPGAKDKLAEAYNQKGISDLEQKRYPEAISSFKEAIKLKEDYPEAKNNLGCVTAFNQGVTAFNQGHYQKAVSSFKEAIKLRENYPEAKDNLAKAYNNHGVGDLKQELYKEAISSFKEAIKIKENYPKAKDNLAKAYNNQGINAFNQDRYQEAISSFKEAIEINDNIGTRENLGHAYSASGNYGDALVHYEYVLEHKPDYAIVHNDKGRALLSLGLRVPKKAIYYFESAVSSFAAAIDLNQEYTEAYNNKALSLYYLIQKGVDRFKQPLEQCLYEAVKQEPNNFFSYAVKGILSYKHNKNQEALEYFIKTFGLKNKYLRNTILQDVTFSKELMDIVDRVLEYDCKLLLMDKNLLKKITGLFQEEHSFLQRQLLQYTERIESLMYIKPQQFDQREFLYLKQSLQNLLSKIEVQEKTVRSLVKEVAQLLSQDELNNERFLDIQNSLSDIIAREKAVQNSMEEGCSLVQQAAQELNNRDVRYNLVLILDGEMDTIKENAIYLSLYKGGYDLVLILDGRETGMLDEKEIDIIKKNMIYISPHEEQGNNIKIKYTVLNSEGKMITDFINISDIDDFNSWTPKRLDHIFEITSSRGHTLHEEYDNNLKIKYTVLSPKGKKVTDFINISDIDGFNPWTPVGQHEINRVKPSILEITSSRGHTSQLDTQFLATTLHSMHRVTEFITDNLDDKYMKLEYKLAGFERDLDNWGSKNTYYGRLNPIEVYNKLDMDRIDKISDGCMDVIGNETKDSISESQDQIQMVNCLTDGMDVMGDLHGLSQFEL